MNTIIVHCQTDPGTVLQRFDLNKHLAGSLGLYRGNGDYEVVVELDVWGG